MSTALDLDLATLVGELEDVPCEHSQHGTGHHNHDDGSAVQYVQGCCQYCGFQTTIYGACAKFINAATVGCGTYCVKCFTSGDSREMVRILGPVNGRSS